MFTCSWTRLPLILRCICFSVLYLPPEHSALVRPIALVTWLSVWLFVCLSCWCIVSKGLSRSSSKDYNQAILVFPCTKYEPDGWKGSSSLRASKIRYSQMHGGLCRIHWYKRSGTMSATPELFVDTWLLSSWVVCNSCSVMSSLLNYAGHHCLQKALHCSNM